MVNLNYILLLYNIIIAQARMIDRSTVFIVNKESFSQKLFKIESFRFDVQLYRISYIRKRTEHDGHATAGNCIPHIILEMIARGGLDGQCGEI